MIPLKVRLLHLLVLLLGVTSQAHAAMISFQLSQSSLDSTAPGAVSFFGTVTNDSGGDLNASDFFFNFSGYDASVVTPSQDLGVTTDFAIANGSTSATLDLFTIALGNAAPGSTFPIQVQLEDVNNDLSGLQTATVVVASPVPLPGTFWLFVSGFLALSVVRWKALSAWRGAATLLVFLAYVLLPAGARAQSSGPLFTTGLPTAGVANGVLYVFIPFSNTGQELASSVNVSSATLGGHTPDSPSFPTQHGALIPGTGSELELQFNSTSFVVGQRYLLALRGTYQDTSSATFGFTLNRFITVQDFTSDQLAILQRFETADAIKQFIDSLPGIDPSQDNQSLLTFLQARPEFVATGINDTTVWAEFSDGHLLLFANEDMPFPLTPGPTPLSGLAAKIAAAAPGSAATSQPLRPQATPMGVAHPKAAATGATPVPSLPVSSASVLLTSLSQFWPLYARLNTLLAFFGYNTTALPATVANLRTVGGQGVVLLTGHGGVGAVPPFRYVISSSDPIDPHTESTDVDARGDPATGTPPTLSWIYVEVGKDVSGKPIKKFFYGISSQFVTKYWQQRNGGFDPSSFVFINACDSDNPNLSSAFVKAVLAAGAGTYGGWTGPVNGAASASAVALTFDRLLGADDFCPEDGALTCTDGSAAGADANPPVYAQRAFPPGLIMRDATLHSAVVPLNAPYCPSGTVCPLSAPGHALQFDVDPSLVNTFYTLAPSIAYMYTLEDSSQAASAPGLGQPGPGSQLFILGVFGPTPGTVTIGGQTLSPCNWQAAIIICVLPDSGAQISGAVQVVVDDHPSNEAAVTRWNGTWTFTLAGPGSLSQVSTFNLAFRSDVRKWRATIHDPPIGPNAFGMDYMKPSNGTYNCGGQGVVSLPPDPVTFGWSGAAQLSVGEPTAVGSGFFWGVATLIDSLHLDFSLQESGSQATTCLGTSTSSSGQESGPFGISWPEYGIFFQSDFTAAVDPHFNILHNSVSASANAFSISFPTTGTLSWPGISPDAGSAPDPKSPR